jgi:hypothetical protein
MSGDVEALLDPYFPFEKSVEVGPIPMERGLTLIRTRASSFKQVLL